MIEQRLKIGDFCAYMVDWLGHVYIVIVASEATQVFYLKAVLMYIPNGAKIFLNCLD